MPSEKTDEKLIVITDPASDRYHTFGYISWWKPKVVRDAKVLVIGAGALGNEVLKNLALMGIGYVFIVDFDTIEDANLSRSILFRPKDNGRRKAEVAAEAVKEINADVKVQFFHGDVNYDLGLGVFRRMDAIIGCLDNRLARRSINQFCWYLNKPWIDGAIEELQGRARVFKPNDGACYECTLTPIDEELIRLRKSCQWLARDSILEGKVPTTPTISSIISAIETQEALKLIHGMPIQPGTELVFNGILNDVYVTKLPVKPDCNAHQIFERIIELPDARASSTTFADMLRVATEQLGPGTVLDFAPRDLEFVYALECANPDCTDFGKQTDLFARLHQLTESQGKCPECGVVRQPISTHTISGKEPFINKTLQEAGVPPLDIVPARNGLEYAYFELTGDAETFFQFK